MEERNAWIFWAPWTRHTKAEEGSLGLMSVVVLIGGQDKPNECLIQEDDAMPVGYYSAAKRRPP